MMHEPIGDHDCHRYHEFIKPEESCALKAKSIPKKPKTKALVMDESEPAKVIPPKPDGWIPFEKKRRNKFIDQSYKHNRFPKTHSSQSNYFGYGLASFILCTGGAFAWAYKEYLVKLYEYMLYFVDAIVL
jgi:hypothetical protein